MGKIKKTIFITGAKGFIGRNLVEQLKNKYHLLIPSRKELDLMNDNQVDNYFKKNKIDIVVHCAVVGGSRKEEQISSALSANLRIFFNIVKNKHRFKKMIQFGSGAEYDKSKPIVKVKETDFGKSIPWDDYGLFKYICSKYIEKNDKIICLRLFGMFGKYEDCRLRFISYSICQSLLKKSIVMNQNVYFDFMYINDLVKIIDYFILHRAREKFYNIGTGEKIDIITLAKIVNSIADKKSKIIVKKIGLNNEYTCDNKRLLKEIKGLKFTKIEEAIKELYLWYKNQRREIKF